jgi:hypothetical protein
MASAKFVLHLPHYSLWTCVRTGVAASVAEFVQARAYTQQHPAREFVSWLKAGLTHSSNSV